MEKYEKDEKEVQVGPGRRPYHIYMCVYIYIHICIYILLLLALEGGGEGAARGEEC